MIVATGLIQSLLKSDAADARGLAKTAILGPVISRRLLQVLEGFCSGGSFRVHVLLGYLWWLVNRLFAVSKGFRLCRRIVDNFPVGGRDGNRKGLSKFVLKRHDFLLSRCG